MEEYFELMQRSPLFESVDAEGMRHILHCLEAYVSMVGKGEIINHYGDRIVWAGIVLEGKVALIAPGSDGEESSIRLAVPPESFGCSHSCLQNQPSQVTVVARKRTKILFLKLSKLLRREAMGCRYASLVTANLLKQTAAANLAQGRRIHVMSQKSIRDKLLLFLEQSRQEEADTLSAMNRQELADYLGTERSALSREMARMKKEGLIDYCRNEIKILSEN